MERNEDEAEIESLEQNAGDDDEDDCVYEDDFEEYTDSDDDDDDDDDDRKISIPRKDGQSWITGREEYHKLLGIIADLENELAIAKSNTAEAVTRETQGLQTKITEIQEKLEKAEVEKENAKRLNQVKGWLWKRGVLGPTARKWRHRWFKARSDGRLYYYKKKRVLKGFIQIDAITEVQDLSLSRQNEESSCFNIVTPTRTYEIKAKDKDDKLRWISDLDHLVKRWPNHQASANIVQVSAKDGQEHSVVCTLV